MILFYVGLTIIFIGLGSVAWLLYSEKKNNQPAPEPVSPLPKETPDQLLSRVGLADNLAGAGDKPQKGNFLSGLLGKFKKEREESDDITVIETEPRMKITKDILQTGTSSVRLTPNPSPAPEPEAPVSAEHAYNEPSPKEKHEKLEALVAEKTEALEKAEKALAVELKNKKEFNKVKDLLEKEIKDDKVKYRDMQVQLGSAQMEATNFKNRVNQLELKVSKLEKTLTEMEHQIKERDEKIFDRETKLKELTDKLSTKDKLESIKVPAEPPATAPVLTATEPPEPQPEPELSQSHSEPPEPQSEPPQSHPEPPEPQPEPPQPLPLENVHLAASDPAPTEKGEGGGPGLKLPPDILTPPETPQEAPQEPATPPVPTPPPEEAKPEENSSGQ